ncbi:MAG: hypothetical protein HWE12_00980 [Oceanospirillaceae bacterium]|nr:hypothetical protein [Oceanospirillaceae bacterium]
MTTRYSDSWREAQCLMRYELTVLKYIEETWSGLNKLCAVYGDDYYKEVSEHVWDLMCDWNLYAAARYEGDDLTEEEREVINAVEFWRL